VIVHVMLPEARALYDLERLWADLPSDTSLRELSITDEQASMS